MLVETASVVVHRYSSRYKFDVEESRKGIETVNVSPVHEDIEKFPAAAKHG